MKLRDLDASFLKITSPNTYMTGVDLQVAQGIMFLCPKCYAENNGKARTHSVICWFAGRGVPDEMSPGPGRWTPSGTSIDDLTFVPGDPARSVSVKLNGGCDWHGFVKDGEAA
jgi:hypothetical protein